jgi:hypothetical protein
MNRFVSFASIAFGLLLSSVHLQGSARGEPEGTASEKDVATAKVYTAYNLWYEKPERLYCVNYHRGTMIPAGTEVASVKVARKLFKRNPAISFTTVKSGEEFTIFFNKKFHPGMTAEEFKDRLLTTKPFEELTKDLTEKEIKCIKTGKLTTGLSKEAVLIARGYPPEHKTSNLESDRWLYWENRFRKVAVHFDENGRTDEVPSNE